MCVTSAGSGEGGREEVHVGRIERGRGIKRRRTGRDLARSNGEMV